MSSKAAADALMTCSYLSRRYKVIRRQPLKLSVLLYNYGRIMRQCLPAHGRHFESLSVTLCRWSWTLRCCCYCSWNFSIQSNLSGFPKRGVLQCVVLYCVVLYCPLGILHWDDLRSANNRNTLNFDMKHRNEFLSWFLSVVLFSSLVNKSEIRDLWLTYI